MENDDGSHDFRTKIGGSPIFREPQTNASLGIITSEETWWKMTGIPRMDHLGLKQHQLNQHPILFQQGFFLCGYGSIPINTMFSGMNIHKSQLF